MQRRVADSPKKKLLPAPTRIPVITPRSSRIPIDSEQCTAYKQRSVCNKNKMSSPVVSSTVVDNSSDEGEVREQSPEKSPEEERMPALSVQNDRQTPAIEIADQNCVPFDEDQQEQDACTKPSDEALFRRPLPVRVPSQKQNQLDPRTETQTAKNQKNKRSKPKVRPFDFHLRFFLLFL